MTKSAHRTWTRDDLVGGHPVLDFLNTAGGATKVRDAEHLVDFAAFLRWSLIAELLSEQDARALHDNAQDAPAAADAALTHARQFREALHGGLMAEQANMDWPDAQRRQVMTAIREALSKACLESTGARYGWVIHRHQSGLALPLNRIVLATETLLRSDDLGRMRNCDRCSWLFIDRGRGRARRWCSMSTCGSRAKSARYYRRKTAPPQ